MTVADLDDVSGVKIDLFSSDISLVGEHTLDLLFINGQDDIVSQ